MEDTLKERLRKMWRDNDGNPEKAMQAAYNLALSERWVDVHYGLPEKDGDSSIYCLVNTKHDGIIVRPYNEYHKCWDDEDGDDHYTDAVGGEVTHWMPLPPIPTPPVK